MPEPVGSPRRRKGKKQDLAELERKKKAEQEAYEAREALSVKERLKLAAVEDERNVRAIISKYLDSDSLDRTNPYVSIPEIDENIEQDYKLSQPLTRVRADLAVSELKKTMMAKRSHEDMKLTQEKRIVQSD